jgi:hypothetical protein
MRKSMLAALVFTLVACGGDKATGPQNVTGTYTLQTVNGANPPSAVYQDTQQKVEVTDGTLNLSANNTWTGTLGGRFTDFTVTPNDVIDFAGQPLNGGTYTLNGSSLTLNDPTEQLVFTGTVSNGTLTLNVDLLGAGHITTLVYSK